MEYDFIKKRTDTQYTDIESFKEYEFRSCIAYELAVRNPKVIELINHFFIEYIEKDTGSNLIEIKSLFFKELAVEFYFPPKFYLEYHFFDSLREGIDEDKRGLSNLIFKSTSYELNDMTLGKGEVYTTYERQTSLFYELLTHKEDKKEEAIISKSIVPNYSRPKLYSFHKTVLRDIVLNLTLPKKELLDFIGKLSDSFNADKTSFKSVNDLFEIDTKDEKIKFSYGAKKVADMFYIYDHVTYLLEGIISHNKKIEEQLLNPLIDTYDKAELREDLSSHGTATHIINSDEYGIQLSSQLSNKSRRTIEDDYNTIYNLIKENSYKTLI